MICALKNIARGPLKVVGSSPKDLRFQPCCCDLCLHEYNRPTGEGGEGHPEGKFVRPTFFSQFGGADLENACYTGVQRRGVCLQFRIET